MSNIHKFTSVEEFWSVFEELSNESREGRTGDLAIIPPDVDELTDEENIADDEILPAREVTEVQIPDIVGTLEFHSVVPSEEPEVLAPRGKPKWSKSLPKYDTSPVNIEENKVEELQLYSSKNPKQIFDLFFTDDIKSMFVNYSNKYAKDKNNHTFSINKNDLEKFIGILILTGYHTLPQVRLYWSRDSDKEVPLVRQTMSRNRFEEIKKYIHLSDNSQLDKNDKFSKLSPFFNSLNKQYMQFRVFSHKLSIDEQMVPNFERHSAKMFIRGKPI